MPRLGGLPNMYRTVAEQREEQRLPRKDLRLAKNSEVTPDFSSSSTIKVVPYSIRRRM